MAKFDSQPSATYLTVEERSQLTAIAEGNSTSFSSVLRQAAREYLARHQDVADGLKPGEAERNYATGCGDE